MYPRKDPQAPFLVLGGFADFLIPSSYVNANGAITGLGNVAPVSVYLLCLGQELTLCAQKHAIAKLFALTEASKQDATLLPEALRLQGIIARADFTIAKASIAGTKYLLEKLYGYGGVPRKPLVGIDDLAGQALWHHPDTQALIELERIVSHDHKLT